MFKKFWTGQMESMFDDAFERWAQAQQALREPISAPRKRSRKVARVVIPILLMVAVAVIWTIVLVA